MVYIYLQNLCLRYANDVKCTEVCELLHKLVLFCDIVSVGKIHKFEVGAEKGTDDK